MARYTQRPGARSARTPLIVLAVVLLLGFVLGTAHYLDQPDRFTDGQAAAWAHADASTKTEADAAFEARARRQCSAAYGANAIFFMLPSGDYVCRLSRGRAT